MTYKYKKLISIILIIIILSMTPLLGYQKADAIVQVLIPYAVYVLYGLCVAGMTYVCVDNLAKDTNAAIQMHQSMSSWAETNGRKAELDATVSLNAKTVKVDKIYFDYINWVKAQNTFTIGTTGTLTLATYLNDQIWAGDQQNFFSPVQNLEQNRRYMVYTKSTLTSGGVQLCDRLEIAEANNVLFYKDNFFTNGTFLSDFNLPLGKVAEKTDEGIINVIADAALNVTGYGCNFIYSKVDSENYRIRVYTGSASTTLLWDKTFPNTRNLTVAIPRKIYDGGTAETLGRLTQILASCTTNTSVTQIPDNTVMVNTGASVGATVKVNDTLTTDFPYTATPVHIADNITVTNPSDVITAPIDLTSTNSLIDNVVTGVTSLTTGLTTGLSNILTNISTLVADVAGINAKTAIETDMTPNITNFRLPDLFVLILKVILACIRLLLRSLIYIATLTQIPASNSMLHPIVEQALNFFKNQNIPVLNVSVWTAFSSVVSIMYSMSVVRKARRLYGV